MDKAKALYIDVVDFYHKVPKRFHAQLKKMGYDKRLRGVTFSTIFGWLSNNYCFALSVRERTREIDCGQWKEPKGFSLSVECPAYHLGTDYSNKNLYRLCCQILDKAIINCDLMKHQQVIYSFIELERKWGGLEPIRVKEYKSDRQGENILEKIRLHLTEKQILSGRDIVVFDDNRGKDRYLRLLDYKVVYS